MIGLMAVVLPLLVNSGPVRDNSLPLDCDDIFSNSSSGSGVYTIYPAGSKKAVNVYCDITCNDKHEWRWTVIQRRIDGSVNFYRPWEAYKNGFGDINGEYWLGLENIYLITWSQRYMLRVELEDFEGGRVSAGYAFFYIEPELQKYKLHISGYIDGGAGDSLTYSNEKDFGTFDKDINNCAKTYEGAFWFSNCFNAHPNGVYKWGSGVSTYSGIQWYHWKGPSYSLKSIVMKIRRVSPLNGTI
ncbi:microfibril-associated glycoprotein 4-like [Brachyhypopomus gauderio]|uniref:microfibril-associated glycoprotein 4-like n=1 Tax=Brachyhypopomus gauderio TaxID=698409 RepID=UPI0040435C39